MYGTHECDWVSGRQVSGSMTNIWAHPMVCSFHCWMTNAQLTKILSKTMHQTLIKVYMITEIRDAHALWLVFPCDPLEIRHIDQVNTFYVFIIQNKYIPRCHGSVQNVLRASVTHLATPHVLHYFFLSHFDVICDQLLNRCTVTWILFVRYIME